MAQEFWNDWPLGSLKVDPESSSEDNFKIDSVRCSMPAGQRPPALRIFLGSKPFYLSGSKVIEAVKSKEQDASGNNIDWCQPLLTENMDDYSILGYVPVLSRSRSLCLPMAFIVAASC